MGLQGRLEDLPILDILRIVAYAKKTGLLHVRSSLGEGSVLFKNGLVVCSTSWSTLEHFRRILREGDDSASAEAVEKQIGLSLRELAALRAGHFNFEIGGRIEAILGGADMKPFLRHGGFAPEHLLLDLAKELQRDRDEGKALIEGGRGEPSLSLDSRPAEASRPPRAIPSLAATVVVNGDALLTEVVGQELTSKGCRVHRAHSAEEVLRVIGELRSADPKLCAVLDLNPTREAGGAADGGLELLKELERAGLGVPTLLMAEALSAVGRREAVRLGVRSVVFKPTLSGLEPREHRDELRAFAKALGGQLEVMLTKDGDAKWAIGEDGKTSRTHDEERQLLQEFLASMTEQLLSSRRSNDISRMVLRVADRYLERGVLFLVIEDRACGIAGFGFGGNAEKSDDLARELALPLREPGPFASLIATGSLVRLTHLERLPARLLKQLGPGRPTEAVLMPWQLNGEVALVLYGDNAVGGGKIGSLAGLELFLVQAGMAMENALLQKKLGELRR